MTPKELEITYHVIEQLAEEFYRRGQQDQLAGKTLETKDFALSKARKLELKTFYSKAANRR